MQARMAYFGEHLSDERVTAQLKAYAANLGTVPDDIAEQAFLIALAKCKCLNYFLRDWTTAVRDIQLDALPSPERMWENVEALLKEAGCTFDDLGHMIVYLRDIADYAVVKSMYDKRFPDTPKVFVHAPVCRPGWLIEMECMGVKALKNKEYAPF